MHTAHGMSYKCLKDLPVQFVSELKQFFRQSIDCGHCASCRYTCISNIEVEEDSQLVPDVDLGNVHDSGGHVWLKKKKNLVLTLLFRDKLDHRFVWTATRQQHRVIVRSSVVVFRCLSPQQTTSRGILSFFERQQ